MKTMILVNLQIQTCPNSCLLNRERSVLRGDSDDDDSDDVLFSNDDSDDDDNGEINSEQPK